ncbi:LLM class flavin-dependent oxidoreductase [Saccharothrix coeruleofusca]|uniref:Luciferase-like monooxygenase n=1 Tax=Saccharothrix coeruleofusca TaxID=33919 RepID=A0A918EFP5_9PSEU|nr:LLM class flavin-dependent oxidoreductase [Saccharothrix coeruleofusca]MBP2335824.1 alkanesulfonate monooxygenase SsuD/methylene tetrahydromethanopterin reductase-like flavin-dependent oxidoreductase (luciferase family) [Saccharothrix coeruleofusca]GGP74965.1 hypothetical protein GCM10010185_55570 [Saccharothrix coeruleofusca]
MSLTLHWSLPTRGDSRYLVGGGHGVATTVAGGDRPVTPARPGQVARRAEQPGFTGAGTALVGSHAEVAERIAEYHAAGVTEVVLPEDTASAVAFAPTR